MKNKYDIDTVLQNNELIPFILGKGKYSYIYPEDGYQLWNELIAYGFGA